MVRGSGWPGTGSSTATGNGSDGELRLNHFGALDDMLVGRLIRQLMAEAGPAP